MIAFLTMVGAVLLGLIVVVVYLNDRVNELEKRSTPTFGGSGGGGGDDNTWHGLSGKRLWDAMTGKKGVTALDDAALSDLRQAYELVLAKHIESLFLSGQSDARKGQNVQPSSVKTVPSPRGQVQSWIPLNHANAIYRAGADSTKGDLFEVERARMSLDEAAQILYSQVNLPLAQLFSEVLMPLEPPPGAPGQGSGAGSGPAGNALAGTATVTPAPAQASQSSGGSTAALSSGVAAATAETPAAAALGNSPTGGMSGGLFTDASRTADSQARTRT